MKLIRLTDFKMNIIKATNNQNSVKSYSLMANDPIQIRIAEIIKFNIIYDRKEKARIRGNQMIISMVNVALAYRTFYFHGTFITLRFRQIKLCVFQKPNMIKYSMATCWKKGMKMNWMNYVLNLSLPMVYSMP